MLKQLLTLCWNQFNGTADKVVSYDMDDNGQMINVVTSTVEAVMPTWKQRGFASREEVLELIKG